MLQIILLFIALTYAETGEWELRKNEAGIKVYTREQEGSDVLQYKVETVIDAHYLKVYEQAVNFYGNLEFLTSISELNVVKSVHDSLHQTYMRIDMPWPLYDRELLSEMLVDKKEGKVMLHSNSKTLAQYPIRKDPVRIQDFFETCEIQQVHPSKTIVIIEGSANPAGLIPAWVVNLFLVEEPFNFMVGLKTVVE